MKYTNEDSEALVEGQKVNIICKIESINENS